jgi:single-strand DNA-binding protein
MVRGVNKVILIGILGRDPELRYTPNGRPVVSFDLAVSRTWVSSDGERREKTNWFSIIAWGKLAEICKQRLKKDQQVYIEGRIDQFVWSDENGHKHYRTEVVAENMQILGDRRAAVEFGTETEEDDEGGYAF